jgi:hypothetical protein
MLKMRIEVKGGCVVDYSLTDDGKPVEYECEIVDYDIMDAERICSQCGSFSSRILCRSRCPVRHGHGKVG